jgi:hypothetical protein
MSDVATALLQLIGRTEPAADPALAAVKLARASLDALILRLGQSIDAKVTAQLAGGLTQLTAGGESFVLKLETPLPVNTAVTLQVTPTPSGQPAVTVTVHPQPVVAQPAPPAPQTLPLPVAAIAVPQPSAAATAPPAALPSTVPPSAPAPLAMPPLPAPQPAAAALPNPQPAPPPAALPQLQTAAPPPSMANQPAPAPPPALPQVAAQPAPIAATLAPAISPPASIPSPTLVLPQASALPAAAPPPAVATGQPAPPAAIATLAAVATPAAPSPAPSPAPTPGGLAQPPLSAPPVLAPAASATATTQAPVPQAVIAAIPPAPVATAGQGAGLLPQATSAPAPSPAAAPVVAPVAPLPSPAVPLRPAAPTPASPPLAQILADPVQAAARQDSVLPLIARLATLAAPTAAALPRPALEAIAMLLSTRLDLNRAPPDGKTLRDAVLRAGIVTEPGTRTPTDAKSALLQLRSALSGFLGGEVEAVAPVTRRPPPPLKGEPVRAPTPQSVSPLAEEPVETARQLLGHADAALSRARLLQLASNPTDPTRPNMAAPAAEFRVEVPMQLGAETGILQLLVERDGKHKRTPAERGWRMRFALNFTTTGEVGADVSLLGRSANVSLWAADPATADALEAMLPELAPALARHGLEVGAVRVRRGAPQHASRAPGQLLDSAR